MGLGLSFVVTILEHHHARLEIESQPLRGATFRLRFPAADEQLENNRQSGSETARVTVRERA
jgi:signal transduction histidine kinase